MGDHSKVSLGPNLPKARGKTHNNFQQSVCEADSTWALGLAQSTLNLLGLWPHEDDSVAIAFIRNSIVPFMAMYFIIFLYLPQMYALYQVFSDFSSRVDTLSTSSAILMSAIKIALLWHNRKVLHLAVQDAIDDWFTDKTQWERSVMKKHARLARILGIGAFIGTMVCDSGYVVMPFFGFTPRILNNVTDTGMNEGRFFPVQVSYPFDSMSSPTFGIVYFFHGLACYICGICIVAPDIVFGVLILHASAQFEILNAKMRHAFDDIKDSGIEGKRLVDSKLKEIIEMHVRLGSFVNSLEDAFKSITLAQVSGLCIVSCFFGYGIVDSLEGNSGEFSIVREAMRAESLLTFTLQVFIYCTATEILASHSEACMYSIFSSDWYEAGVTQSRNIIPIMARARYPMRISAGGFVNLSMNLFLKVYKTSFSYLSVLLAVNKQQ